MSALPTCLWRDPETKEVCGREVAMPSMQPATGAFGPYLCSAHVARVNADRDALRSQAPEGWRLVDVDGAALQFSRIDVQDSIKWDPVAGIGVEEFLGILAAVR